MFPEQNSSSHKPPGSDHSRGMRESRATAPLNLQLQRTAIHYHSKSTSLNAVLFLENMKVIMSMHAGDFKPPALR